MMQEMEEFFNNCTKVKNSEFALLLFAGYIQISITPKGVYIRLVILQSLITQYIIKCANHLLPSFDRVEEKRFGKWM